MVAEAPVATLSEQRVILDHISWSTYESLLADYLDSSAVRFAYDQGVLEIVCPSTPHEEDNRTLAQVVELVADERGFDVRNVGSMTYKRDDLQRGFEPDSSFYIQHAELLRSAGQIDLTIDPPPDLIIEIEVSRTAFDKLPMYARIGVPEIWRGDGERVTIHSLQPNATYLEVSASVALPPLTSEVLTRFLADSHSLGRRAWNRLIRTWAREQAAMGTPPG